MWLMLITIAIGMCLMNGYSVVKEQTHSPHKTENRQRVFVPLHLFPHLKPKTQGLFQNFFQIIQSGINRILHRLIFASLHFCNLGVCKSIEIIQYEPAPLCFGQFVYSVVQRLIPHIAKNRILNRFRENKRPDYRVASVSSECS